MIVKNFTPLIQQPFLNLSMPIWEHVKRRLGPKASVYAQDECMRKCLSTDFKIVFKTRYIPKSTTNISKDHEKYN